MKRELVEKKYLDSTGFGLDVFLYLLWKECPKYAFEAYKKKDRQDRKRAIGFGSKISNKELKNEFNKIVSSWNKDSYKTGDVVQLKGYMWYNIPEAGYGIVTRIDENDYVIVDWKIQPTGKPIGKRSLFHMPTELCVQTTKFLQEEK